MSNPTIEDRLEWTLADNVRQAMEISRLSSEGALKDSVIEAVRALEAKRRTGWDASSEWQAVHDALAALVSEEFAPKEPK